MRTQNIPLSIKKRKSPLIIPNLQLWDFFQVTQERVQNSRGIRAISALATESLLCLSVFFFLIFTRSLYICFKYSDPFPFFRKL